MTPKEKAQELVDKYYNFGDQEFDYSKEFALIAVDEILDVDCFDMSEEPFDNHIEYWNKVKQEIEKI
jgi:hypothetical protein